MDIEKRLLEKALDSILHGSTQMVTQDNGAGNVTHTEVKINDLRYLLVEHIARLLVNTEAFQDILLKAITPHIIKKMRETAIKSMKWSDMPYGLRNEIESQMKDAKVEVKRYKIVAEVVRKRK